MGRRTGRDDERRMPNCCRWGCSSSRWREVARGAGGWRRRVVTTPQSAADRMPQIRSRIGSWITGSNRGSTGTGTSRTFHTVMSLALLACSILPEWSYIVSIALRASLSCQRSVTTKYTDHTTSMTTIQSKTSIDVMLRLSASNTSSATICVARPKSITVSFKESKPHSISTATLREPVKKETYFSGRVPRRLPSVRLQ